MTPKFLESMPSRSTCVFYGSMKEEALGGFDPLALIGRNYTIEGFILGKYLEGLGAGILPVINKATALMANKTFQSKIQRNVKFSQFESSVQDYYKNMTAGKFVLMPHEADEDLKTKKFEVFDIKSLIS